MQDAAYSSKITARSSQGKRSMLSRETRKTGAGTLLQIFHAANQFSQPPKIVKFHVPNFVMLLRRRFNFGLMGERRLNATLKVTLIFMRTSKIPIIIRNVSPMFVSK